MSDCPISLIRLLAQRSRASCVSQVSFAQGSPEHPLDNCYNLIVCEPRTNNGTTWRTNTRRLLYGRRASTSDPPRNRYSNSGHSTAASTAASPPVQPRPQPRNGYCNKHGSAAKPAASRSGRTQQPWGKAIQSLTQSVSYAAPRTMGNQLAAHRTQGDTTTWPCQRPRSRE